MAAPPARARADYDFLIKLLLIGDSGNIFLLLSFKQIRSNFSIYSISLCVCVFFFQFQIFHARKSNPSLYFRFFFPFPLFLRTKFWSIVCCSDNNYIVVLFGFVNIRKSMGIWKAFCFSRKQQLLEARPSRSGNANLVS